MWLKPRRYDTDDAWQLNLVAVNLMPPFRETHYLFKVIDTIARETTWSKCLSHPSQHNVRKKKCSPRHRPLPFLAPSLPLWVETPFPTAQKSMKAFLAVKWSENLPNLSIAHKKYSPWRFSLDQVMIAKTRNQQRRRTSWYQTSLVARNIRIGFLFSSDNEQFIMNVNCCQVNFMNYLRKKCQYDKRGEYCGAVVKHRTWDRKVLGSIPTITKGCVHEQDTLTTLLSTGFYPEKKEDHMED